MPVSFIHDIEEALIDEINTKLGVGSTVYPTPGYLQVQFVGRAGGRPIPLLPDQDYPAIWLEYLAGAPRRSEIGHGYSTQATESFNILGIMRVTPEVLGCPDDDLTIFTREAEAAAGILLRRLMLTLVSFDPSVYDELLGYKTNGQRLGGWAYNGITKGEMVIDYSFIIRYESLVVI